MRPNRSVDDPRRLWIQRPSGRVQEELTRVPKLEPAPTARVSTHSASCCRRVNYWSTEPDPTAPTFSPSASVERAVSLVVCSHRSGR